MDNIDFQPHDNEIDFQPAAHNKGIGEEIEPGVYGETRPVEQKLLENSISALNGATLPSGLASLASGAAGLTANVAKGVLPENAVKYLRNFADESALKNLGASIGQIKDLGKEKVGEAAKYYFDKKIGGPMTGKIGMEQNLENLDKAVGGELGSIRAGANADIDVPAATKAIQNKLDPEILKGARAHETGVYQNALDELGKLGPTATPAQLAEKATYLNQQAKTLGSLKQPNGAMADVANELSHLNNMAIRGTLTPEQALRYDQLRKEFGNIKALKEMAARGERREMAGRSMRGLTAHTVQELMDTFGYKSQAELANALANLSPASPAHNAANAALGGAKLGTIGLSPEMEDWIRKQSE